MIADVFGVLISIVTLIVAMYVVKNHDKCPRCEERKQRHEKLFEVSYDLLRQARDRIGAGEFDVQVSDPESKLYLRIWRTK